MKKLLAGLLCTTLLLGATPALAAGTYTVEVDGAPLALGDLLPYEENGRVMLPLRPVAEALGFAVSWDQESQTAGLEDGRLKSAVTIGADRYYLSGAGDAGLGTPQSFGAAPALVVGTTFVPAELFTLLCGQAVVADGVVVLHTSALAQIANPMRRYETLDEVEAVLDFPPAAPTDLPEGYENIGIWVIGGTLLELRYHSAEGALSFRMAAGSGDVSGDYRDYPEVTRQTEDDIEYVLKGAEGRVFLLLWTAEEHAYALSLSQGVDADAAIDIARSVATAE